MLGFKTIVRAILGPPISDLARERERTLKDEAIQTIQTVTVNNALANPRRRHIMEILEPRQMRPGDITGAPVLDYHMDVLERAGLIEHRNGTIEVTQLARSLANPANGSSEGSIEAPFTKPVEITNFSHLLPCPGDPSRFRISAKISPHPGDSIVLLWKIFPSSLYSERMKALVIPLRDTIVTLYSSGNLSMVMLKSEEEAWEILEDLKEMINQSILLGLRGRPRIDHMEINRRLPHTNCGECGEKSCYYFAVKLAYNWTMLDKCKPLTETKYSKNLEEIKYILDRPGESFKKALALELTEGLHMPAHS